jgi:ligand-binding SRPBCC domain-containing protein
MGIHVLQRRQIVAAPLENCWRFFSDPRNLAKITPPALDFQIIGEPAAEMYAGMMIQYRVRPLLGIPMRWLTEITRVEPMRYFVDEQRVGPYKVWHHEHWFSSVNAAETEVRDVVHYVLPFGPLGDVVNTLVVQRELRKIFDFREAQVGTGGIS